MVAIPVVVVGVVVLLLLILIVVDQYIQTAIGPARDVPAFPRAPFTWGDILNAVANALHGVASWFDNAVWPLCIAVWTWTTSHLQMLNGLAANIESSYGAITRIVQVYLPGVAQHAQAVAEWLFQRAEADARNAANAAQFNAETYAHDLAVALSAQLGADVNALEAAINQVSQAAYNEAVAAELGAERYAQQLAQQLLQSEQALGSAVIADLNTLENAIAGDFKTLSDAVQSELQGIEQLLGTSMQQLQGVIGQDVGAAVAPLSLALSQVISDVTAIEQSECMKFCNPLGNLGAGLQLLDIAAIIAFLAEVAANPDGAAKLIEGGFETITTDAVSVVNALLGTKAAAA